MKNMKLLIALLAALGLLASACGSSTDSVTDAASDAADAAGDAADAAGDAADDAADAAGDAADDAADAVTGDDAASMPGEGVEVTMGRADWTTGYFQAEVFRQMLQELGYTVSDPADLELSPSLAYLSMAEGDFDFWANSWYPGHKSWLENELPDGTKVGDHLTRTGDLMPAGGLQGYLVTKAWADEAGFTTLDQIASDPALVEALDSDGDGKGEIYGCPDSWTCDNIITEAMCQFGWDETLTQTQAGYDAMIAEAVAKADAGEPMVIYTWTPSAYITQLRPSDNVYWLGVEGEVTDVNCSEQDNGEEYAQPDSIAAIDAASCPVVADAGECNLGWTAADIQVTANTEFLSANPAAAALLEAVKMPLIDVALANVDQAETDGSSEAIGGLAADWIAANRDLVDGWLETARAAG